MRRKWLFLLAIPAAIGYLWLMFNCQWKWRDIRFEKVNASEIRSIKLIRDTPGSEVNLASENIIIDSPEYISQMLKLMHENESYTFGHLESNWHCYMVVNFLDKEALLVNVTSSRNQGTMLVFCFDCVGIKNDARNDRFGAWLEDLVGYTGPVK